MKNRSYLPAVCLLIATAPSMSAFSSGAPSKVSGAPGEKTCNSCHLGGNPGSGKVQIEIVNASGYTPGQTLRMRVLINDDSARRWGFELTARADKSSETAAGSFKEADDNTQVLLDGVLQYVTHTSSGTRPNARGQVTFEVDWTPPSTDLGQISFYVAANAANGNNNPTGDTIYTGGLKISAATNAPRPAFRSDSIADLSTGQPGLAPGTWVTLKGTDLAAQTAYWSPISGRAFDTKLAKVTVKVNDVAAPLQFVSPSQITFLVPAGTPEGDVPVVIDSDGVVSETVFVRASTVLPAIVSIPENSSDSPRLFASATTAGSGAALSFISPKGWILNKPEVDSRAVRGALPGEEIDIYAIGLGRTDGDFVTDRLITGNPSVSSAPTVLLGGTALTPTSTALVAPGVYVVRVKVPDSLATGEVPILLESNGIRSKSNVFLYIQQ